MGAVLSREVGTTNGHGGARQGAGRKVGSQNHYTQESVSGLQTRLWRGSSRAVRSDPDPLHQELQKVPRSRPRVVAWTPTLEETPTTAAPHGDAARLLPVLRLAPLRPQAQLDPPRSPATLGARPATPRSTTADQLGVFEQSTVVRAAVSSHIASSGMKRRSSQKSSGEPSAGNLHAGFCLGRRVQEATLAR